MNKTLKIIIAFALLLCLLDMPYGYYQLVRFLCLIVFGFFAFDSFNRDKTYFGLIYLSLAILFQPIIKIALGRTIWNIVDIIVAVFLIWTIIKRKDNSAKTI